MEIFSLSMSTLDIIAFIWFITVWVTYTLFADQIHGNTSNLVKVMHRYRLQWMRQMLKRSDRLVDIRIISNLLQSTTFFASTSILIVAGLFAALSYGPSSIKLINSFPWAVDTSLPLWLVKTTLLLVVFITAFFKFTWVLRQFNYATVLIAAAPVYHEGDGIEDAKRSTRYAMKAATMLSNAARHFNRGIRSYYFGLAALSWYLQPWLLIAASLLVVFVLYRREFMSKTLVLLA